MQTKKFITTEHEDTYAIDISETPNEILVGILTGLILSAFFLFMFII